MLCKISVFTFLTAIVCMVYGAFTTNHNPIEIGRLLMFFSVLLVSLSMVGATLLEMTHSIRALHYRRSGEA